MDAGHRQKIDGLEVWLVDDGSTDAIAGVSPVKAAQDSRIWALFLRNKVGTLHLSARNRVLTLTQLWGQSPGQDVQVSNLRNSRPFVTLLNCHQ